MTALFEIAAFDGFWQCQVSTVVGKLLTQGLIEEIPARGALPIWRRDEENGAVALRITRRGLAAIRIDEHRAFLETQEPAAPGKGPIHGNEFS